MNDNYSKSDDRTVGFFTDTTLCIGCKACEVACKQWNQLPDDGFEFTGMSYDNTGALGAATWRHVSFVERPEPPGLSDDFDDPAGRAQVDKHMSWLMMSDVCKHCERAGCLEACPTGAIVRTDKGTVLIQSDICNGCAYCIAACPFGVVDKRKDDGRAWKCTFCYDRLEGGLEPACAKACPTDSIQFGDLFDLQERARQRLHSLQERGVTNARLYGVDGDEQPGTEGLHAFFLLVDRPEVYNLPPEPEVPTRRAGSSWGSALGAAAGIAAVALAAVSLGGGIHE